MSVHVCPTVLLNFAALWNMHSQKRSNWTLNCALNSGINLKTTLAQTDIELIGLKIATWGATQS